MPASTPSDRYGGVPHTLIVLMLGASIIAAALFTDSIVWPLALWIAAVFVTVRPGRQCSRHAISGGGGR